MSTLTEHKAAIRRSASLAVFGDLFFGFPEVAAQPQRTVSDYDLVRLQYRGQAGAGNTPSPRYDTLDKLYLMQPGSKIVQVQTNQLEEDEVSDSNIQKVIAVTNIFVHRALLGDWEEALYEDEMLVNQGRLLSISRWRDLSEVSGLEKNPILLNGASRQGPIISYDITFEAGVTPD